MSASSLPPVAGLQPNSGGLLTFCATRMSLAAARGVLSAALVPLAALAAREQVFDLADASGPVERAVDGRGADKRALGRRQGALHIVDGEDVFRTKRSRIAMAMAPPTMAVPSGRLTVAFDMMELPKNVRSTSP